MKYILVLHFLGLKFSYLQVSFFPDPFGHFGKPPCSQPNIVKGTFSPLGHEQDKGLHCLNALFKFFLAFRIFVIIPSSFSSINSFGLIVEPFSQEHSSGS